MTGLFDKIKKRAGFREKADAKSAEVEFKPESVKVEKPARIPTKSESEAGRQKTEKKIFNNAYRILIKPVVSEKASIAESFNAYSFIVAKDASKKHIKEAVEQIY